MKLASLKIFAAAALVAGASAAQASPINFEGFSHGQLLGGPGSPTVIDLGGGLEVTITAGSNGSFDVPQIFDTTQTGTQDPDLELPKNVSDNSELRSKILIITENNNASDPDDEAAGGTLRFDFNIPVIFSSIDIVDAEPGANEIGVAVNGGAPILTASTGDELWETFTVKETFVNFIEVTLGRSGGVDNLAVRAVPLPGAAVLLLSAIGGFAGVRRMRKSASA